MQIKTFKRSLDFARDDSKGARDDRWGNVLDDREGEPKRS